VVGNGRIQAEAQEPGIVETFPDSGHEFTLAGDIFQKEEDHRFHQHHRVDRDVAIGPVAASDLRANEGQIQHRVEPPQRVIGPHPPIQIDLIRQLLLRLVDSHHGDVSWTPRPKGAFIWATRPRDLTPWEPDWADWPTGRPTGWTNSARWSGRSESGDASSFRPRTSSSCHPSPCRRQMRLV